MKPMFIDIIIVNWNSGGLLKECVESVFKSTYPNYLIHIVDNNSADDSIERIKHLPKCNIIRLSYNAGFGKACNIALEKCQGEFILLLNPDARVKEGTLQTAVSFMERNRHCIVYGCAQTNNTGEVQKYTVGRFPTPITFCNEILGLSSLNSKIFKNGFIRTDWDYGESQYVCHVMGSFYLLRRSWVLKNGFMDDRFFIYLEDIDLSKRIINDGGKIYFDRENIIYHTTGGVTQQVKAKRLFYSLHAKQEFIKKYFSFYSYTFCMVVMVFFAFFSRILHAVFFERRFKAVKEAVKGYLLFYRHLILKDVLPSSGNNSNHNLQRIVYKTN